MSTKKRLIFALLYNEGHFCQSRNFRLQKVGMYDWLFNNYNFSHIAEYLDELVVINVNPSDQNEDDFLAQVKKIVSKVFIPVAIGGGIKNVDNAKKAFNSGADKVILNSLVRESIIDCKKIIDVYGSQSVVGSIDYKTIDNTDYIYDWKYNTINQNIDLQEYIKKCEDLGFGEILINSVNRDGTGFGYDIDSINRIESYCNLPLMVMGGAGSLNHFKPTFKIPNVDACVTANLLNFIGDALQNVRHGLLEEKIDLAKF
ncbi:HisA/HisF-related TIM barrel protein [Gracilimonas amylolytica]|uniref:HisA/HisF-related TIM barrel protein n=1 Tax=Gracilimonas amylolytica TaxID=1749045 RepID=UPI000CD9A7DE|nr:HisA/HisF-related TIM barrel protein [Gracilimonas amylolytica]